MSDTSNNQEHLATALHELRKVSSGSASDNVHRIAEYIEAIETEIHRINRTR
ncbi:hypothetical protein [Streptomyces sp. NPDC006855]|uniref:hypothetical protein n=1 Tax=Streptomyces sp. NPDC006855 TaxID=3364765 RepID=UPI00368E29AF